jgi:hypothetical protein
MTRCANSGYEQMQQVASLLDHLIGAREQGWRHSKAECPGCRHIDREMELGPLLDRYIGWPQDFKALGSQIGSLTRQSSDVAARFEVHNASDRR